MENCIRHFLVQAVFLWIWKMWCGSKQTKKAGRCLKTVVCESERQTRGWLPWTRMLCTGLGAQTQSEEAAERRSSVRAGKRGICEWRDGGSSNRFKATVCSLWFNTKHPGIWIAALASCSLRDPDLGFWWACQVILIPNLWGLTQQGRQVQ